MWLCDLFGPHDFSETYLYLRDYWATESCWDMVCYERWFYNFLPLSFHWATLLKNDISIQHKLFCIHKNLSFIDETITCKFSCVFRVHIVMLNNLVGRPMVEMQTQVGLKLFSNTSTPSSRETDNQALHAWCPSLLLWHEKWLFPKRALCIFGKVNNSKRSRMRWHLEL